LIVHDLREGFVAWGEDEVGVVGHQDVGVELIVRAVVFEGFEEEFGVASDLEDAATVVAVGGDEEGALRGGSLRDCHSGSLWAELAAVKCILKARLRQSGKSLGMTDGTFFRGGESLVMPEGMFFRGGESC
jgi:hypothetical protein